MAHQRIGLRTIVINAAAFTDVDGAEVSPRIAYETNANGAENVARACADAGAELIHISTNSVFENRDKVCDELDTPEATSEYAVSKLLGEHLVRQMYRRATIVRTGFLYGVGGRNFGSTLARKLRAGERIAADGLRLVQPTNASWVAYVCRKLTDNYYGGTYHAVSGGSTTWREFATRLAYTFGHTQQVHALDTAELDSRKPYRAKSLVLASRMLPLRQINIPIWQDQYDQYVSDVRQQDQLDREAK